jgi:hypothetical protein
MMIVIKKPTVMICDTTVDITPPAGESAVRFQPNVTQVHRDHRVLLRATLGDTIDQWLGKELGVRIGAQG